MKRKVAQFSEPQLAQGSAWFARPAAWVVVASACAAFAACGGSDPQPPAATGGSSATGGSGGATSGGAGSSSGGSASGGQTTNVAALLPFAEGDTWTYKVTDADEGTTGTKITTVGPKELVGGDGPFKDLMAFKVETRKGENASDKTESWQLPAEGNPQRVERFRELSYGATSMTVELEEYWNPAKIHIDGSPDKIAKGSWTESYQEFKKPTGGAVSSGNRIDLWKVLGADESVVANGKTYEHAIHLLKTGNSDPDSVKEYWYVRGVGKVKEAGSSQTEELVSYTVGGTKGP